MKILILLSICTILHTFTDTSVVGIKRDALAAPANDRVFVEIRGSGRQVLTGILNPGPPPLWMAHPDRQIDSEVHVYANIYHQRRILRFIANLRTLDFNVVIPETRCFVRVDGTVYFTVLGTDYSGVAKSGGSTIFVRRPGYTTLAGLLIVWNGPVSPWVV